MAIEAPDPAGFLYGYFDTGVPGAKTISVNGTTKDLITVLGAAEGYRLFTDLVDDWDHFFAHAGTMSPAGSFSFNTTTGICSYTAPSKTIVWTDRAAVIFGFNREPGDTQGAATAGTVRCDQVPAGAIWLAGSKVQSVELKRVVELSEARWRRNYGYVWGGAHIYRWKLTMHRDALKAFDHGYCSSGRVRLQMSGTDDLNAGNSDGYQDGYVLGVESVQRIGPVPDMYQVNMLIVDTA